MLHSRALLLVRSIFAAYMVALGLIVFLPGGDAEHVTGIVVVLARALEAVEALGIPFEVGYTVVEFTANIALFVPFGVLLGLLAPRWPAVLVIASGFALSAGIEFTQTMLPTRYSTVSDVIANSLGTAIGFAVLSWWLRRRQHASATTLTAPLRSERSRA